MTGVGTCPKSVHDILLETNVARVGTPDPALVRCGDLWKDSSLFYISASKKSSRAPVSAGDRSSILCIGTAHRNYRCGTTQFFRTQ